MTTTTDSVFRQARTRDLPDLLRPEQVAEVLQITPRTVRRWGATGRLQRVRLGDRLTRYTAGSVAALIDPSTSIGHASNVTDAKSAGAGDGHAP
ncbi:MAG: helix-turn-helix transcriptional regulator [Solirubrobacteraceae bacterium]